MARLAHLYRNRFGVFYFHLTVAGREIKRSLATKDPPLAKMHAASLNWQWAMTNKNPPSIADILRNSGNAKRFDVVLPSGAKLLSLISRPRVDKEVAAQPLGVDPRGNWQRLDFHWYRGLLGRCSALIR